MLDRLTGIEAGIQRSEARIQELETKYSNSQTHEVHNAYTVIPVQTGIHPESGALRMQYRSHTFKGVKTAISIIN